MPKRLTARKLLIASIGVATVNYVAACNDGGAGGETSGNLVGPVGGAAAAQGGVGGQGGAAGDWTSGNLMSPPGGGVGGVIAPPPDSGLQDMDGGTPDDAG